MRPFPRENIITISLIVETFSQDLSTKGRYTL
jgi:hypothetical protein